MTTDLKNLLRLGIPIAQRGAVWKAIVDHKLNGVQSDDYYKNLLANYNPGLPTPAARQVSYFCIFDLFVNLVFFEQNNFKNNFYAAKF